MEHIDIPEDKMWEPLENTFPDKKDEFENFMFMDAVRFEDTVIYCYKHIMTRRYLNIDEEGRCYIYYGMVGDGYRDTDKSYAWLHAIS